MFLNGYTTLAALLSLLRLLIAVVVVALGLLFRFQRRTVSRDAVEDRSSFQISLTIVLVALNISSWPLLYVLLQSYVRQWPEVMCIYGVTRIGEGTIGASRFLPELLRGLQWTRPSLVFASGAGLTLYMLNRRTQSSPLIGRIVVLSVVVASLSMLDSVLELAYVAIPRTEHRVAGGCCTNTLDAVERGHRYAPAISTSESQRPLIFFAHYGLNLTMIAGLLAHVIRKPPAPSDRSFTGWYAWLLLSGSALSLPLGTLFLTSIAAPRLLRLPFHHCPYDLVTAAPEAILAVSLSLLGTFCVGWAFFVARLGQFEQTRELLPPLITRLLFVGLFGYLASLSLTTIELLLLT